jgi:RNA polymerase nonessential primary-like sigma factor
MRKGLSNEQLVVLYRESRDEAYLQELIDKNMGLLNQWAGSYAESIPNAEKEDLISESYIPMLRAIEDFDPSLGLTFGNLLKVYVRQHLNRLYAEATRKKRFTGSTPVSYDSLTEINKDGGDETESTFTVECEEFSDCEFRQLLASIDFNEKERVAVTVLMAGGTKGEVAKALQCTPATANYYFKTIRKKFVFAGVSL